MDEGRLEEIRRLVRTLKKGKDLNMSPFERWLIQDSVQERKVMAPRSVVKKGKEFPTWRFVPSGEVLDGRVTGLIYHEPGMVLVGEWTAWVYRAGEVSLQCLIQDRKENGMRALYQVAVVDPETEEISFDEKVIATSSESARFKVLKATDIEDLEMYDIIVVRLGDIRAKKQVQEVKIVGS